MHFGVSFVLLGGCGLSKVEATGALITVDEVTRAVIAAAAQYVQCVDIVKNHYLMYP
jgi:hypothetical protein